MFDDLRDPLVEASPDYLKDFRDADEFFRAFYKFYADKGMTSTLLSELCAIISLAFVITFSFYLFNCVDWSAVMSCTDEDTCLALSSSFTYNPFDHPPTLTYFFSGLCFLIFTSFLIWRIHCSYRKILLSLKMATIYNQQLQISESDITEMEWSSVVEKLVVAHNMGRFRVLDKDSLTVNDVILRIMRSENYMIAMINRSCLDMFLPWWLSPYSTEEILFTKAMEWSLSYCILDGLFDADYRLASNFTADVDALKLRFQVCGLAQLILLPFTCIFVTMYFFFENAQQFHSNRSYLGPRQWTPLAKWEFREFNELPHLFEERLNKAYHPAHSYLTSFYNPYAVIVAELISFLSGAFVAVLIIVSFLSEGALLYIHVADHNLLWYLGIFSAIFAASRSLVPDNSKPKDSPAELLNKASAMTHHFSPEWLGKEHTTKVRNQVSSLLQYKIVIFLMEIAGAILTPIVLLFSLPSSAPSVVDFVK